ncbi:MAG: hypothetical protein GXO29_05935 [Thermotogae bacterium]|nr:hypothetical protein [Thermotogota bacterium]
MFGVSGYVLLWSNAPVEEWAIPSFRNYDYYFNGSYSTAPSGYGVALDGNAVPGAARLSLLLFADTGRGGVAINYARYMGIADWGFGLSYASRPAVSLKLSSFSKRYGVGVGLEYSRILPFGREGGDNSLSLHVFGYRKWKYRIYAGYSYMMGERRGRVEAGASYRWRRFVSFLYYLYEPGILQHGLKIGMRITLARSLRLAGATILARGREPTHVLSLGAQLPR